MMDSKEDFKEYWCSRYPAVALGSMEADWAWVGWRECAKHYADRIGELEAQRVPEGIKNFVRVWEEKPIRGLDKERIYTIHGGTEWEAGIRFSDLKAVVELKESE